MKFIMLINDSLKASSDSLKAKTYLFSQCFRSYEQLKFMLNRFVYDYSMINATSDTLKARTYLFFQGFSLYEQ